MFMTFTDLAEADDISQRNHEAGKTEIFQTGNFHILILCVNVNNSFQDMKCHFSSPVFLRQFCVIITNLFRNVAFLTILEEFEEVNVVNVERVEKIVNGEQTDGILLWTAIAGLSYKYEE